MLEYFSRKRSRAAAMFLSPRTNEVYPGGLTYNDLDVALISNWLLANGFETFKVSGDRPPYGITLNYPDTLATAYVAPGSYIICYEYDPKNFYPISAIELRECFDQED